MESILNEPIVTQITAAVFVPAGGGTPVHTNRRAYGLAYNTGHTSTYRFSDGRTFRCHSGQCIFLPMGSSYTVDRTEPSEDPTAGVHAVNFLLEGSPEAEPAVFTVRSQAAFLSALQQARRAWRQKHPGHRELCLAQVYTMLSILGQERLPHIPTSRAVRLLEPALAHIQEQFAGQEITADRLAELCGVSQPYLRRLFHSAFGMPPARYIRHKRLLYARELLDTGEYSVSQAAAAAGFNDTAYFSREFKAAFGAVPSRYPRD